MEPSRGATAQCHADLVELVRQAQGGSNDAAQQLFFRCREPLLAVIRCRLSLPLRRLYDSDDFLASTFVEVFTRHFSDEVLQSPTSLLAYLKRIAENKVHDAARKYLATRRFNIRGEISLHGIGSRSRLCGCSVFSRAMRCFCPERATKSWPDKEDYAQ